MPQARVTWPQARVMADGRVRIPVTADQWDEVTVNGTTYIEYVPDMGWEVETIPDPEPTWEPGDVVRDMAGNTFVRTDAGRWRETLGRGIDPVRPLDKLE